VKRLKEAGFTEEQAEAEVNLVAEAMAANIKDLATKQDIEKLKSATQQAIRELELGLEIKLSTMQQVQAAQRAGIAWLKWLSGAIAVGFLAQLLKTFGLI
jgi:hypothetical protein